VAVSLKNISHLVAISNKYPLQRDIFCTESFALFGYCGALLHVDELRSGGALLHVDELRSGGALLLNYGPLGLGLANERGPLWGEKGSP
jgi:hypothetical protein